MSDMLRILERGYELIWREDRLEDALAGLSPDFAWVVPDQPEGAVRHGPDAVLDFFRELVEPFEHLRVDTAERMVLYNEVDEARRDAGL